MIHPDFALSPAAGRAEAVRVSWGLVQIPIRLHIVTEGGNSVPSRSMFTEGGNPIGKQNYDKSTGLTYGGEVTKKVLVGSVWVELTDAEIEAHATATKGLATIETFIPLTAIGTLYASERVGAWTPDTMKIGKVTVADPNASKAAALLRRAMDEQGLAALILVPSKAGGRYVALCPDGSAHTLSFADQVRLVPDTVDEVEVTDAELALAEQLIAGIGVGTPILTDAAGDLLRSYLEAKASGAVTEIVTVVTVAPAVDLMAALTASLAATAPKAKRAPRVKAAAKVSA